ncbi:MAG: hypothetical protein R6U17_03320 [Thermoplasmata archaeon]
MFLPDHRNILWGRDEGGWIWEKRKKSNGACGSGEGVVDEGEEEIRKIKPLQADKKIEDLFLRKSFFAPGR